MWGFLRNLLLLLNLLHQTIKVLMHFVLMCHLVFTLAHFKSLNIGMYFLGQLIFLHFFHMLLFFLGFNLLVKESFGLHLFLLSLINFVLLLLCFLLGLALRMVLHAVEVFLELVIACNASSDDTLSGTCGIMHLFLDHFDTALVNLC